jgi:hypothetical protein
MILQAVAEVDVLIIQARWHWLHAVWGDNVLEAEAARAAIDALLERRHEITQAAAPVA